MKILVVSQSLAVEDYRSFYTNLLKSHNMLQVSLVTSKYGRELGGQVVACDHFVPPLDTEMAKRIRFSSLHCYFPHVQIWLPFGLWKSLRKDNFDVLVCLCEPYSLSFLWFYLHMILFAKGSPILLAFSAQNIKKNFGVVLNLIQQLCYRVSRGILFVGKEQKEVAADFGWKGASISFPLWYNENRFFCQKRPKNKIFRIGYAGSYTEQKGLRDLLESCQLLGRRFQNFAFSTSGSGPLSREIENLKNQATFEVTDFGAQTLKKMSQFYNSLDLLVVPSRTTLGWKEQFGRVIIEAQACGVDVIGSNSGEIPNVIDSPQDIFDEGNIVQLTELIDQKMRDWTELSQDQDSELREFRSRKAFQKYSSQILSSHFYIELCRLKG